MLASLFSKTKPINYILVSVLLGLAFVLFQFMHLEATSVYSLLKTVGVLGILVFTVFLIQFIVLRNRLVSDNAYVPLLFLSFILMFPNIMLNARLVVANFFILLALRRLYSLHSLKNPQEKLFDASLWILIATLFHFWSVFYIVLIFYAVASYVSRDYKNWLIPFIALFVVFIFLSVYLILVDETYLEWIQTKTVISFDFTQFDNLFINLALAVFASIALLFFFAELIHFKKKQFNLQSSYKKVILSFIIAVAIYIVSNGKNEGSLLFTFFPLAILGSNYIEMVPQNWRKEAIVYSVFGIAVFFFVSQLIL
ncbi:DUF6427 family protein [Myroides guanonis]|uniref:Beta-carotene 15,15'-monooxygenase n=1 Tax=Myroides guanonis TaxID=1150112 RepID=A0A1I3RL96_9FLAO|nr:DUF6427 family protein [Myroides guanonis]SFJ46632.1 hypothetical protein SAMN04487893_10860 [Myroides guanonis]